MLYVAIRTGAAIDPQDAFDTATDDLGYLPPHTDAHHVAEAARDLAQASLASDEPRLAVAVSAFLEACGYEPGFEVAPDRFARATL